MEKKKLPYLPHELIIEILLRLPVKSLTCFKCVCKLWFSLISNPHFANSHFQLHTHRIMGISKYHTEFRSIDFEALNLVLNYDPHPTSLSVKIIGSCRGFIFLICGKDILLWNPSTGFKTQIPFSPIVSKLASKYDYYTPYGFGYDQLRDDYLVVVWYNVSTDEYVPSSHLEFFSVRDNRWKEIEGAPLPYSTHRIKGLFFNGAIHWLAFHRDFKINVIVTFDLKDRKLFEIPLPDYFQQELPLISGLWVFGEFLSLWTEDIRNGTIELWVMKEYKLNSSWTKTLVIPEYKFSYIYPIFCTNNGDIIGTTSCGTLVKYNRKGQLLESRSFLNGPSNVVLYTESLLSLPIVTMSKSID